MLGRPPVLQPGPMQAAEQQEAQAAGQRRGRGVRARGQPGDRVRHRCRKGPGTSGGAAPHREVEASDLTRDAGLTSENARLPLATFSSSRSRLRSMLPTGPI